MVEALHARHAHRRGGPRLHYVAIARRVGGVAARVVGREVRVHRDRARAQRRGRGALEEALGLQRAAAAARGAVRAQRDRCVQRRVLKPQAPHFLGDVTQRKPQVARTGVGQLNIVGLVLMPRRVRFCVRLLYQKLVHVECPRPRLVAVQRVLLG